MISKPRGQFLAKKWFTFPICHLSNRFYEVFLLCLLVSNFLRYLGNSYKCETFHIQKKFETKTLSRSWREIGLAPKKERHQKCRYLMFYQADLICIFYVPENCS